MPGAEKHSIFLNGCIKKTDRARPSMILKFEKDFPPDYNKEQLCISEKLEAMGEH